MTDDFNKAVLHSILPTLGIPYKPAICEEDGDFSAYWIGGDRSLSVGVDDNGVYWITHKDNVSTIHDETTGLLEEARDFVEYIEAARRAQ